MEGSGTEERYDSFEDYSSNKDIYDNIKSQVGVDFDSFPDSIISKQEEKNHPIIMNCLRLRKYLMNFRSEEECKKKNCCQYINHLLNHAVRDGYSSQSDTFNIFINYMNHHNNRNINNLCVSKLNYMKNDKYQKIEKLYNVYKLYKIFNSKKRDKPSCSSAKACAKSYDNIKTTYTNIDDTKFCKALKDFKEVFEKNEHISRKECASDVPNLLSYPDVCNQLLQISEKAMVSMEQQNTGLQTEVEPEGPRDQQKKEQMADFKDENSNIPISMGTTIPITLFSSGIGALLIFISFYKFTPFGHLLRSRTQRFKGISEHLSEEEYEMKQHISEYDERNSEYNEYNILYNS
ncbi:PIR Superfamily Protein [Plasmodium ovale wallikeri]|uniref:PIR Superfamily Protein n=1 Tax=Plasmodium ovale wallikeri TaxID=864142 RepID=A0A1A9AJ16_PLAOA|nr:PIR Superfamily Protein [Plasmodium ovale wallikeri]SBT58797.1 PIR Superfamily Protein [Plasmodium ovale wallikeri]